MRPTRALLLATTFLLACSSEPGESTTDTDVGSRVRPGSDAGADIARDFRTESDADSDVEDTEPDTDFDVAPDSEPDVPEDAAADTDPDSTGDVSPDADTEPDLVAAVCGDGIRTDEEGCDDGNTVGGDGCDSSCGRELYFVCRPCDEDSQCGWEGDRCIDGACGADCSVLGCGDGFDCVESTVDETTVSQCAPVGGCPTTPPEEICDGLVDDDDDGLTDCEDPDCSEDPLCAGTGDGTCADPIPIGLSSGTATPTNEAQSPSCSGIDEVESVFVFTPAATGVYCLDSRGSGTSDTIISTRTVCGDIGTELTCDDDISGDLVEFQAYVDFTAVGTSPIYVLVDTYGPDPGDSVTLTISAGACGDAPDGGGDPDPDIVDYGTVGCLDSLDDVDASGATGDELLINCPTDCARWNFVYGTDIYSADSYLCPAAIHQGTITDTGGDLTISVLDGQDEYTGSIQNGITSNDWTLGFPRSFTTAAR